MGAKRSRLALLFPNRVFRVFRGSSLFNWLRSLSHTTSNSSRKPLPDIEILEIPFGFVRRIRDRRHASIPHRAASCPREHRPRPEIRHRIDREHQEHEAPTIRLPPVLANPRAFARFYHVLAPLRPGSVSGLSRPNSLETNVGACAAALIGAEPRRGARQTRKSMQPQRAQSTQREEHGGSRGVEARARCDRRVRGRARPGRVP